MTPELWAAYVATVLVVMVVPGPSHLLMLSNSLACGFRPSLATAAGDLSANLLQMLAAGMGLAAVVLSSSMAFSVVKWGGVAYLLWLALRMIATPVATVARGPGISRRRLWMQGFVTSAANPKAVVFFAALFPQFLSIDAPLWPQLSVLALTYLVIDALFLTAYGVGAAWLVERLRGGIASWLHRIAGALLLVAAVLLGLRTVRE